MMARFGLSSVASYVRLVKMFRDAFQRYADAGLVNARFAIDGVPPAWWGYHVPGDRWNGWATPSFTREAMTLIAEYLNSDQGNGPDSAWWEGETLCIRGSAPGQRDDIERYEPDDLGLYPFDGWCWIEYLPPTLVAARFALDDSPAWWGYHVPGQYWNGWATPSFTRDTLALFIEWLTETGLDGDGQRVAEYSARWEGDTLLIVRQGVDAEQLSPDEHGLYDFTGWCWTECRQ
jgi:hypothetical protein